MTAETPNKELKYKVGDKGFFIKSNFSKFKAEILCIDYKDPYLSSLGKTSKSVIIRYTDSRETDHIEMLDSNLTSRYGKFDISPEIEDQKYYCLLFKGGHSSHFRTLDRMKTYIKTLFLKKDEVSAILIADKTANDGREFVNHKMLIPSNPEFSRFFDDIVA